MQHTLIKVTVKTDNDMDDVFFMKKALDLAGEALAAGEFPVGCVIVQEDRILAQGRRTNSGGLLPNEIDHAEMNALRQFSSIQKDIDKSRVSLYCTLEPCLMCFGAILINGIKRIVYAYEDAMGGGTRCNLQSLSPFYKDQRVVIIPDILRTESLKLFIDFFADPKNQYLRNTELALYSLKQHSRG